MKPAITPKSADDSFDRIVGFFRSGNIFLSQPSWNPLLLWLGLAWPFPRADTTRTLRLSGVTLVTSLDRIGVMGGCLVVWLPVDDVVHEFSFRPTRTRIFLSSFLWILLLIRGGRVQSFADPYLALFHVLAVLIVVYLPFDVACFLKLRESLLIQSLMPVLAWLPHVIPTVMLSRSAAVCATFLL